MLTFTRIELQSTRPSQVTGARVLKEAPRNAIVNRLATSPLPRSGAGRCAIILPFAILGRELCACFVPLCDVVVAPLRSWPSRAARCDWRSPFSFASGAPVS